MLNLTNWTLYTHFIYLRCLYVSVTQLKQFYSHLRVSQFISIASYAIDMNDMHDSTMRTQCVESQ